MTDSPRSINRERFSTAEQLVAHALAHTVGKPALWLIEQLGYSERMWRKIGETIQQKVALNKDFGLYQPTASDVIVCTFPKSGTNWALQIVHQIATRGHGEYEHIHDVVPWPDVDMQDFVVPIEDTSALAASPTGLRAIKTHLPWGRLPYSVEARYICVVRDPKDALVSMYHFVRDICFGPLMPSVSTWVDINCRSDNPHGWAAHLDSYWQQRELGNLLILTFADMKADLGAAVRRIAGFMGVSLSEGELATVCEKSGFAYMKRHGDRFKPPPITPLAAADRKMIRRGASGGSSELLTPAQQAFIDRSFRAELARLGCDFPYDEHWGPRAVVQ